jgi:hypothetical protein
LSQDARAFRLYQRDDKNGVRNMATAAELAALRKRIARILIGGECARIAFQFGSVNFRSGGYAVVGMSIGTAPAHAHAHGRHHQMGVQIGAMPDGVGAQYESRENVIWVPDVAFGATTRQAISLVHEATHAVFDYYRIRVTALEEEAIAYISGAMYGLMRDAHYSTPSSIGAVALPIARALITPSSAAGPVARTVTQAQRDQLISTIRASPIYRNLNLHPNRRYTQDGGRI